MPKVIMENKKITYINEIKEYLKSRKLLKYKILKNIWIIKVSTCSEMTNRFLTKNNFKNDVFFIYVI